MHCGAALPLRGHTRRTPSATAALTNDQKALTSQMEQLLHALHAQSRQPGAPATPPAAAPAAPSASPPGPAAQQQQQPPLQAAQQQLRPFAVVDEVSHGSPASSAGIHLGDQLCRFGPVVADTPNTLQQVAGTLQVCAAQRLCSGTYMGGGTLFALPVAAACQGT